MKGVKVFCTRCLSTVKADILRVVSVTPPTEEMGEIKVEVQCPNCHNVFQFDIPKVPRKEGKHELERAALRK